MKILRKNFLEENFDNRKSLLRKSIETLLKLKIIWHLYIRHILCLNVNIMQSVIDKENIHLIYKVN